MVFLVPILIIGVLTTFTDLKSKKIYNNHLVIGAVLGLITTVYAAVLGHEHVLFHLVNGLVAFLVGLLLHRSALWRGGDAKLFTLYAFLMPVPVYSFIIFPSVVSLFACSFIAGTIILFPVFIKDIVLHRKTIANDLFLPAKREALFRGIVRIIFFTWAWFPFYYLTRMTNPIIILTVSYLIFSWRYNVKKDVPKHYIIGFFKQKKGLIKISLVIIYGFLMRLWLFPDSLSFWALARLIIIITLSTAVSTFIHTTFTHFKDYHERIPFAPLLFMGCVLSYTPFLTSLIHVMVQWNVLFSR